MANRGDAEIMSTRDRDRAFPMLGTCPMCEAPIPNANLLIKYETDDGWPRMFAECPSCETPVHPK